MSSVNTVHLLGRVGKDPEVRRTPSGKGVATLSLATSSKRKGQDGQYVEQTEWHRLNFFDRLAEIVGEHVKKGSQIYVEGKIKYGKYTDKDGVERQTTDILCDSMTMLGGADKGAKPASKTSQQDDGGSDMPW